MLLKYALSALGSLMILGGCASKSQLAAPSEYVPTKPGEVPEFLRHEGYFDGSDLDVSRTVAPGIEHRFVSESKGPRTINAVFIDMARGDLTIEAESGQDNMYKRETVELMSHRLFSPGARPVVAMNADFWAGNSAPVNMFVDEGMIWRSPFKGNEGQRRSIFAFDNQGNYYIGQPEFSASITAGDKSVEIDDINFPQGEADVVAYTWPFGDKAPAPPEGWSQVVLHIASEVMAISPDWLPNEPVAASVAEAGGRHEVYFRRKDAVASRESVLPKRDVVVVHFRGDAPDWLQRNVKVTLAASLVNLPGKVIGVVGGGPQLVDEGEVIVMNSYRREAIAESFTTDLHPRSAIGIMPDGKTLLFMVVDGRQPSRSQGINLPDLAERFKAFGVRDAMNLDGGGSSSIVVRGDVVNFPSDASGPRSVTNALIVRRTAEIGALQRIVIEPESAILPVHSEIALTVSGFDEGNEPVALGKQRKIKWSVASGDAAIDDQGVLHAGGEGTITVRASAKAASFIPRLLGMNGPVTTAEFEIAHPATMRVQPRALLMSEGDARTIHLQAFTQDNRPFWHDPSIWTMTTSPNLVFDGKEQQIHARAAGPASVRAAMGGMEISIPATVDRFSETLAYDFDALPANEMATWISAVRHNPSKTTVTLDRERKQQGQASWKMQYGMERGGTTKIALPVNVQLPGEPLAVGVWVYGDNQEQWLRGLLRDANGTGYFLDFTNSGSGINWEGWKFVRASLIDPAVSGTAKGDFKYPVVVEQIYIAQAQEAAKRDGEIWIDGLTALGLP